MLTTPRFFLDGTEVSLRSVFEELGWYAKFSGLQPNVSKCFAMWIGQSSFAEEKICIELNLNWGTKVKLLGIVFRPDCSNIVEENLTPKKEAMMKICGMWKSRNLSLIGKITIVKTYLLSQLTHVLASLPSPNEKIMREINQILFSFVWGSTRNPLKRKRLCQSLELNGLEMIDLRSYCNSLKMSWIRRFVGRKDRTWHLVVPEILRNNFVWNFGVTSLRKVVGNLSNPFWKDVISSWITFSKAFEIPDNMIVHENIFNSDFTKFKVNKYSRWERRGIRSIGDLFEGNKLMTYERFRQVYSVPCYHLEYMGLVHSLPKHLQKSQPTDWYQERPIVAARLQFLLSEKTYTKFFVRTLMNQDSKCNNDVARIKSKWIRDIDSFENFSALAVKRSTIATKYIAFQYKLVMRILTTNTFLRIIGKREDDKCTFCGVQSESLSHLFLTCQHVQKFWNDINVYLRENDIEQLTNKQKIFGDIDRPTITHVVTLAKYVIYEARRDDRAPSFAHFQRCLKRDIETERFIARKNLMVESFNKKWSSMKCVKLL